MKQFKKVLKFKKRDKKEKDIVFKTENPSTPHMSRKEMEKFLVEVGNKYSETFRLLAKDDF